MSHLMKNFIWDLVNSFKNKINLFLSDILFSWFWKSSFDHKWIISSAIMLSMAKRKIAPFGYYFKYLDDIDKGARDSKEFGSILILSLVEEVGEMSRSYLAEHVRKQR